MGKLNSLMEGIERVVGEEGQRARRDRVDAGGHPVDEAKKVSYAQISKAAKKITDNAVWNKEMKKLGLDPENWNTGFDAFVIPIIVATVNGQGGEVDNTAMQSAKQMLKTILKSLSGSDSDGMSEAATTAVGDAVIDKIVAAMIGSKFESMMERHLPEKDFPGLRQKILDAIVAAMKQAIVQYGLRVTGASLAGKAMRALIKNESVLAEAQKLDSKYVQRGLRDVASDEGGDEGKFLKWIADRLNQSYPDGDVSMATLHDLAKEPAARHVSGKIKDWRGLLKYAWGGMR